MLHTVFPHCGLIISCLSSGSGCRLSSGVSESLRVTADQRRQSSVQLCTALHSSALLCTGRLAAQAADNKVVLSLSQMDPQTWTGHQVTFIG